jgi:ribosomal-protein-alanine N-acetyltransferase
MTHVGTKQIETERLVLRRITESDAEPAYRNWCSDDKVTTFLRWPTHESINVTEFVIGDWVKSYAKDNFYHWAIELKETGEPIGSIGAVEQNERLDLVEIGYAIGSKWWRQGIVSEAFAAIIPFLFDQVKANRIEAQHDPKNPNSGKVMLKCGLTYEGTRRKASFSNQGIVDAAMYALLAEDYYKNEE